MAMEMYRLQLSTAPEDERALTESLVRAAWPAPFLRIQSLARGLEDKLS